MLKNTFAALLLLNLCACSQMGNRNTQAQYELVTIEQQAKEAIINTPTEFRLPLREDSAAWARVELFFRQYTKSGYPGVRSLPGGGLLVSNISVADDRYAYSVEKYMAGGEMTYLIECRANQALGGVTRYCQPNAQNLARFIKEGQLELSYLAR